MKSDYPFPTPSTDGGGFAFDNSKEGRVASQNIRVKMAPKPASTSPSARGSTAPPGASGALPAPNTYADMMSYRASDYRALQTTWVDQVARRKGIGIYEEMLYDPQVSSSLDLLKFAILSQPHKVRTPEGFEDDKEALKAVDLVKRHIATFEGGFKHLLHDLLSMLDYGYGITELLWETSSNEWRVARHVSLPPALYAFSLNPDSTIGAVTYLAPNATQQDKFPLDHFMILRWQPRFEGPYGRSQLRRAYNAWWMKQLIQRMRNTALDRFGSPFVVFQVPKGTPKSDRKILKGILENLSAESGAVVDVDYQIKEVAGAGAGAASGFQEALAYEDAQIAKAITGVTLNANESQGAGNYALGKIHQDNFLYYVEYGQSVLAEAVTSQLVSKLCLYNLGTPDEKMPVFDFESVRGDDVQAMVQALQFAMQEGIVAPEKEYAWIRDRLGFPVADEDAADIIEKRSAEIAQNAVAAGAAAPATPDPTDDGAAGDDAGGAGSYGGQSGGQSGGDSDTQQGGQQAGASDDQQYGQWLRGFIDSSPLFRRKS